MPDSLTLLMAQLNPTVGDINANTQKIIDVIEKNQKKHDIIVFPECVLTGYPPEDLLFRTELFQQIETALQDITAITKQCHIILGHPSQHQNVRYNSASILHQGQCLGLYHKQYLPNYGVFDEKRYFTEGNNHYLFTLKNHRITLGICEDLWPDNALQDWATLNADILISINASPFDNEKYERRETLLRAYAEKGLTVVYVNQVGGQDELVFDGRSLVLNPEGHLCARAPAFKEHLQTVVIQKKPKSGQRSDETAIAPSLTKEALLYQALLLGLRDYVEKNKFPGVLVGLSGGIDSALTLCLAVDALGADRVHAVLMPSRFTANISTEDAKQQAKTLNVMITEIPIEPLFAQFLTALSPSFQNTTPDVTEENIQARVRGTLLMALSNKTKNLLLTTSNKSEIAVGYSTLYGDMAGGFAPLKDVLKTTVNALARYRNEQSPVIPQRVLTRPPSAELAFDQKDEDNLPNYTLLDGILTAYQQHQQTAEEIINNGYDPHDVARVLALLKQSEYKRHQSAPGTKITPCAFGRDWRYPLTSGFQGSCKIKPNR